MSDQIIRIFFIYKKLLNGYKYSSTEFLNLINNEFGETSLRSVQRDLKKLRNIEPLMEIERDGSEVYYKIRKEGLKLPDIEIMPKHLLSLYILKAHLKLFKNTNVENEVVELEKKLELHAKGDVFEEKSIFWDKNQGYYDYTQYDPQIRRIIKAITENNWVKVKYESEKDKQKYITCRLIRLFTYSGSLYTVAYVPKHKSFIAITVQNTIEIEFLSSIPRNLIKHKVPDFDMDEFSKYRFGVFWGEPKNVELLINKKLKKYFVNRSWSKTQKISFDNKGNMILKMKTPVSHELISWILSWTDAITVVKPIELKAEVLRKCQLMINKHS